MIFKKTSFKKAKPIWEKGEQKTQNHTILFESFVKQAPTAVLRISGYTGYQVFINGEFVHWGPARAGRGYYRVDEFIIGKYLKDKNNRISVLSTGYYTDSFEWFKEPSFICAEIEANDSISLTRVILTGKHIYIKIKYKRFKDILFKELLLKFMITDIVPILFPLRDELCLK